MGFLNFFAGDPDRQSGYGDDQEKDIRDAVADRVPWKDDYTGETRER